MALRLDTEQQWETFLKAPPSAAKLPTILNEMTHPQFRKIKIAWAVYKEMYSVPNSHVPNLLYSACTEEVQNSLINSNPNRLSISEEDLLNVIEKIVTKSINSSVHKINFRKMYQTHDFVMIMIKQKMN